MKLLNAGAAASLIILLAGCNSSGLNQKNIDTMPTATGKYNSVTVYKSRNLIPKNAEIGGFIKVQNFYANGFKIPPEVIVEELKKQAVMAGGVGIINVTIGKAQTTADIVYLNKNR